MALDYNIISKGVNSIGDYQRLQDEFDMKKQQAAQAQQLGDLQMLEIQKKLTQDPNALTQKDKWDIILKQQELRQKAGEGMLTTNPNVSPASMDLGQFSMPDFSALTNSQINVESSGNPNAVSPKGAFGLMQLMPGTQTDPGFGVKPAMDNSPQENVRVGEDYRNAMLQKYGDMNTALMAYNWGPGNVDKWIAGGRKPSEIPQETVQYVQKVTSGAGMPTAQPTQQSATTPLYQAGKPFTTGLNAGYQWATDAQGNRVAMKVPGTPASKEEMEVSKQKNAKERFDDTLLEMQDLYKQLADEGQIRNQEQGTLGNVADYYRNNPWLGGKQLGDMYNTPSSAIREKIDAAKSRAAALYIDAAGLSSGQTNAAAEQERFLAALGGYNKGFESNQQILEGLSKTYGTGKVKQKKLGESGVVDYTEYFK